MKLLGKWPQYLFVEAGLPLATKIIAMNSNPFKGYNFEISERNWWKKVYYLSKLLHGSFTCIIYDYQSERLGTLYS